MLNSFAVSAHFDFRLGVVQDVGQSVEGDLTGGSSVCVSAGGGGVLVLGCVFGALTFSPSAFGHGSQCLMPAVGGQRL